jgi:hypothetical protein
MAKDNALNPKSRDPNETKNDLPRGLTKARVLHVPSHSDEDGFHTVRIKLYGTGEVFDANVLMPMAGCVWIPEEGNDVVVLFAEGGRPWVIGSWYAQDRVREGAIDLPSYENGDIRLGNGSGSYLEIGRDGYITLRTEDDQSVDIDHHTSAAYLNTVQTIQSNGNTIVELDTERYDNEDLFDPSTHTFTVKEDGLYGLRGKVRTENPGQNNVIEVYIEASDGQTLIQNSTQTSINAAVGVETTGFRELEAGTEIKLYVNHNKSSTIDLATDLTEMSIARQGT